MIINIHKPAGITSFDVIRIIKHIFRYPTNFSQFPAWQKIITNYQGGKIGHAGTLDPFATGVLIVCTDRDTKTISQIQTQPKQYIAGIKLGFVSDSYDIDGIITPSLNINKNQNIDLLQITEILQQHFTGEIMQTPPIFSAKKIKGKRAYELARAGKSVKLAPQKVLIYNIGVNNFNYPNLELIINCSTGTYIRSIAHDLGCKLGVGAYCHSLVRTQIGEYHINNSISLPPEQINIILNKKHD